MKLSYSKNNFYENFTHLINNYCNIDNYNEKDIILAYTPARILYELNNVYIRMCFENRGDASPDLPMLSAINKDDSYKLINDITVISTNIVNEYGTKIHEDFIKQMDDRKETFNSPLVMNFIYPAVISMVISQLLMPTLITEDNLINKK